MVIVVRAMIMIIIIIIVVVIALIVFRKPYKTIVASYKGKKHERESADSRVDTDVAYKHIFMCCLIVA